MSITPTRPYLLRALYDWILDNGLTPHLLVNTEDENVVVPTQHIEDDRIVLNINPNAIRDLNLGNDYISFSARFDGKLEHILVPIHSVIAIYARENGEGMAFPDEALKEDTSSVIKQKVKSVPRGKPELKVIK